MQWEKHMCDTLFAGRSSTKDGIAILAKNSDRTPNEGQHLQFVPAANHAKNSRVKCTYIEIPQVKQTNAVLLSKPYWMWGAEMGINEHGVAIGNEAVYTRGLAEKTEKLLGMDLLRLGLERASTAREALDAMISLLEQFGQGGNCVAVGEQYYNNSFIIADANAAWVLETIGQRYAARQVKDVMSVSNCLSIERNWDIASPDLAQYALQQGWAKSVESFSFAKDCSDFLYTNFGKGNQRQGCTLDLMRKDEGKITVPYMMNALRNHNQNSGKDWQPQNGMFAQDVCMHIGFGPIRISQSTASLVVHLDPKHPTVFVTGTSAPCTSIFKPVWLDASLPDTGPVPINIYDSQSLFWQHELLHREVLKDYGARMTAFAAERDALEMQFVEDGLNIASTSVKQRGKYSAECFFRAGINESKWLRRIREIPAHPRWAWLYNIAWEKINQEAKIMPYL
jgi:secernin